MKHFVFLMIGSVALSACTSRENADAEERKIEYAEFIDNPTEISFDEMHYNFGSVTDGDMVTHIYKFKNTGDQNLILLAVTGSCGCTVPEDWPQHPLAPGETGEIKVVFNSSGRVGNVLKNVTVEANTNPTESKLSLQGVVLAK